MLRAAAQNRAAATSLRATAAEVGVSYSAFRDFVGGSEPYSGNLKKLTEWYLKLELEMDLQTARNAIRLLLKGIPDAELASAGKAVTEAIRIEYERCLLPVPGWVTEKRLTQP